MTPLPVRVVKFGGSITGSGPRLAEAADRLLELRDASLLVVASAPGEITDEMLRLLSEGGVPPDDRGALGPLWRAEQIGAELLASAIRIRGREVRLLQPDHRDWPLLLRTPTFGARVDLPETRARFRRLWSGDAVPPITVLPGFIGVDGRGRPGTLSRGGGDTTAVVAARCLGAPEVLLVKDVPGILPADPRIVPGSPPLEELSADELELLCQGGAPVVALEALRYLTPGLRIRVVGLDTALAADRGTIIRAEPPSGTAPSPEAAIGARAGTPTWVTVTALPNRESVEGTAAGLPTPPNGGRAPPVHAVSWVVDAAVADEVVRRLLATGVYRAASHRPFPRLDREDGPDEEELPRTEERTPDESTGREGRRARAP